MASSSSYGSGLRSTFSNKTPHLSKKSGNGLIGELADVRADLQKNFSYMPGLIVEEFTDVPAAGAAVLISAKTLVLGAITYTSANFNGTYGAAAMTPPRRVYITYAGASNHTTAANSIIVTGVDANGNTVSDTLTPANTAATTKSFVSITSLYMPANSAGIAGTFSMGFDATMGLRVKPRSRAGLVGAIREISGGAAVTTGTLTTASGINGVYTAAADPDATRDYCIYYELDSTDVNSMKSLI